MKKLLCLLLALLCCATLIMPVFADIIFPSGNEPPVPVETLAGQNQSAAKPVNPVSASASSVSPTVLYLVIGALVLAAALVLFLLLRKKAR